MEQKRDLPADRLIYRIVFTVVAKKWLWLPFAAACALVITYFFGG